VSDINNPYAAPAAQVFRAASVSGLSLAERGSRLAAVIVDSLITFALYLPLLIGVLVSDGRQGDAHETPVALIIGGLISVVGAIALIVYTVQLVSQRGQTIGKRALDIKVVRGDDSPIGLGRSFWLRNFVPALIGIVPLLGPMFSLVDILMIFSDDRRCLHDRIADTKVVKS